MVQRPMADPVVSISDGARALATLHTAGRAALREHPKRPLSGGVDRGELKGRQPNPVSVGDAKSLALSNVLFSDSAWALTFLMAALVQERLDHAHGLLDSGCPLLSSLFVFLAITHSRCSLFWWSAWVCRHPSSPVSRLVRSCSSLSSSCLYLLLVGN